MDILIVEDDAHKISEILELVESLDSSVRFVHHDNVFGTVNYIRGNTPKKIILDMSLPSHPAVAGEGSPLPMSTGGMEIILELKSLKKCNIPIIILTQYPDVEVEYEYYSIDDSAEVISALYGIQEISVVHYDFESGDWRGETRAFLEK